ncbi:beta-galactosidase [Shewanella acanthi]|uniref:beta-galactosidase n=1 Tax=Shewanella acanthi TaxID=2864212 RepID=UPI001C65D26E|nr:beta-galactosidase [Shewanella acanthi]QYJ78343.1 beta-galactosidase [Shewanella acanthi]
MFPLKVNLCHMKKLKKLILCSMAFVSSSSIATSYNIDLDVKPKKIVRGHLNLGGVAPDGSSYDANSYYLEKDGKPFMPVLGEFHYSRYPVEFWEESLRKMKAGGVNVIATYVFWNLHEPKEGEFDFSGNLDLRHFISIADRVGLPVIVRLGPFCHGEMRNGGMPDWLYGRTFEVRSNDEGYLNLVDKLYAKIGEQLKGLYFSEGGPVIGAQVENEYQHSAAPWEITYPGAPVERTNAMLNRSLSFNQITVTDGVNPHLEYGVKHMKTLRALAEKHGIKTPYYTATGWGNATIVDKGSIPVSAGYAYPFWEPEGPSDFFMYKDIHLNPDYSPVSYDASLYPSIPAEIGPGIMPLYTRRPYFVEESLLPMMVRILGSGSNGVGYYMYHGGSTPLSKEGRFMGEELAGVPKINYDFQAPIGEYGQVRSHFQSTKLLHFFMDSFGQQLAPMQTVLPKTNSSIHPKNKDVLRYAARVKGKSAFIFMHNFQDDAEMENLKDLNITASIEGEKIRLPENGTFTLNVGESAILPINLDLDGVNLKSATLTPLTSLRDGTSKRYVFTSLSGMPAEFEFDKDTPITGDGIKTVAKGKSIFVVGANNVPFEFTAGGKTILVVPYSLALQSYRVGDSTLAFSDSVILENDGFMEVLTRGRESTQVMVYPKRTGTSYITGAQLNETKAPLPSMSAFNISYEKAKLDVHVNKLNDESFVVTADSDKLAGLNQLFLRFDYVGDRGAAFINGYMAADHFWMDKPWEIGLRGFISNISKSEMVVRFYPLYPDAKFLEEFTPKHKPSFKSGEKSKLSFEKVELIPEYKALLSI